MNKEISDKVIEAAVKKAPPVKKPVDNLLVLVVVINKETGKIVDVVTKPSILTGNLTVENYVENDLNISSQAGCDKRK